MNSKTSRNILISLLLILGISAIGGDEFLIILPSGKLIGGLPFSILASTPFSDFLFPGIILVVILGDCPCLVSITLVKKPEFRIAAYFNRYTDMHWSWTFSLYIAFALMLWIQVQTIYVQSVEWLQTFYMMFSILIIFVAFLSQVRLICKK